jgi:hypothetical protein
MISRAVARERAVSTIGAHTNKFQATVGRRSDVIPIKVDEPILGLDAVRIVTRGAGGFLIHDMEAMAAILAQGIRGFEALVRKDAAAIVTFVTEGVIEGTFRAAITEQELALQDGAIQRTVGSIRSGSTGSGGLIIIMAIGAVHPGGGAPRSHQAGYGGIASAGLDGVEGSITAFELKALVGFGELTIYVGRTARNTVRVTAIAKLIFKTDLRNG